MASLYIRDRRDVLPASCRGGVFAQETFRRGILADGVRRRPRRPRKTSRPVFHTGVALARARSEAAAVQHVAQGQL